MTQVTDAELVFGNPSLFSLRPTATGSSVTYKKYDQSVTLGGVDYKAGAQQVLVIGGQIDLGPTFSMVGNFNIILDSGATDSPETPLEIRVLFANLSFNVQKDSKVLIEVMGNGEFRYTRGTGLTIKKFEVTRFDLLRDNQSAPTVFANSSIESVGLDDSGSELVPAPQNLPSSIKFGNLTLNDLELAVVDLGISFTATSNIQLSISVALGIKEGSLVVVGDFGAKISDRDNSTEDGGDNDEYAIAGAFITDVVLDPIQAFAQSGGTAGAFDLQIDTMEVSIGSLLKATATDSVITLEAVAGQAMVEISDAEISLKVGPLAVGGKASNFGFYADGKPYTGKDFLVTVSLGANDENSLSLPSWLPSRS